MILSVVVLPQPDGPEQHADLAVRNFEVDPVERDDALAVLQELLRQLLDLDHAGARPGDVRRR